MECHRCRGLEADSSQLTGDLYEHYSTIPHAFEAVEVYASHFVALSHTQTEDGRLRSWEAVGVLIHQELVVGAVDRVVQHSAMEADLDVLHCTKRPV